MPGIVPEDSRPHRFQDYRLCIVSRRIGYSLENSGHIGWMSTTVRLCDSRHCIAETSLLWFLLNCSIPLIQIEKYEFSQSRSDERSRMIKGLGRDVRVTVGQANTIHECVAPANPPNFHHRITKKHQIWITPPFCHNLSSKASNFAGSKQTDIYQAKSISDNYARSTKYLKFIKLVWVTGGQSWWCMH